MQLRVWMMENVPAALFEAGHDSRRYIVVGGGGWGLRPIFDDSQRQTLHLSPQRLLFNLSGIFALHDTCNMHGIKMKTSGRFL